MIMRSLERSDEVDGGRLGAAKPTLVGALRDL